MVSRSSGVSGGAGVDFKIDLSGFAVFVEDDRRIDRLIGDLGRSWWKMACGENPTFFDSEVKVDSCEGAGEGTATCRLGLRCVSDLLKARSISWLSSRKVMASSTAFEVSFGGVGGCSSMESKREPEDDDMTFPKRRTDADGRE